jgi:transcriptional regulator with XRE-family HTH domain
MQLSKRIRKFREQKGLSQIQAAEKLGMGRLTYASIETGERDINIKELELLARIFEVSVESILQLDEFQEGDVAKYRQMCLACIKFGGTTIDAKITKTKLAKLLYLVDFSWYRTNGISMSGMQYFKLPLGPVAKPFFRMIDEMFNNGMINIESKGTALLISANESSEDKLADNEILHIQAVCSKWRDRDTQAIVEFTHHQAPWAEVEPNSGIPYELAESIPEDSLF